MSSAVKKAKARSISTTAGPRRWPAIPAAISTRSINARYTAKPRRGRAPGYNRPRSRRKAPSEVRKPSHRPHDHPKALRPLPAYSNSPHQTHTRRAHIPLSSLLEKSTEFGEPRNSRQGGDAIWSRFFQLYISRRSFNASTPLRSNTHGGVRLQETEKR